MTKKVYIRGAYGPGNLGDDILLICMINIVKEVIALKNIFIGVENVELAKKLNSEVNFVHYKKPLSVDVLIYGGGGQFFDFEHTSQPYDSKNSIVRLKYALQQNKNLLHAVQRVLLAKHPMTMEKLIKAKNVASYSIGIGPFEEKRNGFARLTKFNARAGFVALRDPKSMASYRDYFPNSEQPLLSADPTFISSDWHQAANKPQQQPDFDYSYIIREWPYSDSGKQMINLMIESCRNKHNSGEKVRLVSLFGQYDSQIIESNKDLNWLVYDLNNQPLDDFLDHLVNHSKHIISARAHGVWLPSILGIPTLAIGIENKLVQVAKSLGDCTLLSQPQQLAELEADIASYTNNYHHMKSNIQTSLNDNEKLAKHTRKTFQEWLTHVTA